MLLRKATTYPFSEDDRRLIVVLRALARMAHDEPSSPYLAAIKADRHSEDYANDRLAIRATPEAARPRRG